MGELTDDASGIGLAEGASLNNRVKEFPALCELKHEVDALWRVEGFVHGDDVRVLEQPHDLDLRLHLHARHRINVMLSTR